MDEKTRESNRLRQRKYLEVHKDEVNEKRREKYHERISLGKCPRCGKKVKKGRTLCTACCEYMLDLNRKYSEQKKAAAAAKVKTPNKKVTNKKVIKNKVTKKK
jgi:endogenous inhibitor of DNA gyrase (YacG/DUF329 family)